MKSVLIWAVSVTGVVIAYGAKNAFGISDLAFSIAWVGVLVVALYIHFSHRLTELEERVIHQDYSGIKAAIRGERHAPLHQQPKSLIEGGALASFITAAHETLFEDFRWFGAMLNQHVAEPWAIEELNDTSIDGTDGPEIGRQYQVYYNACKMGTMQVTVGGHGWIFRPETFPDNRLAYVEIELSYLRFVPYNDIHSLLSQIILFIGRFEDGEAARARASEGSTAALTGHLWESVRNPEIDMSFEFTTEGPYDLLRKTVDHWKSGGIDPFREWGGDRSWADQKC